jgi:hypothetical protein
VLIVLAFLAVNVVDAAAFIEERGESHSWNVLYDQDPTQFQRLDLLSHVVVVVGLYVDKNQVAHTLKGPILIEGTVTVAAFTSSLLILLSFAQRRCFLFFWPIQKITWYISLFSQAVVALDVI